MEMEFTKDYAEQRLVEYVRTDESGEGVEVLLNGSTSRITVLEQGEILYERNYRSGILGKHGILIRKRIMEKKENIR